MSKYILSLVLGCIIRGLSISYYKYRSTTPTSMKDKWIENNLGGKSEQLKKEVEEKTPINGNKKGIEKQSPELKIQILQYQTENTNLNIGVDKIHDKRAKVVEYAKIDIDEEKILQLIEKSKLLNLQKLNRVVNTEKLEYIDIELVTYNYIYEELVKSQYKYIEEIFKPHTIKNYIPMLYVLDILIAISQPRTVIAKTLLKYQQENIFLIRKIIVKIAKRLHPNPKISAFNLDVLKKDKIYYLYKNIFNLINDESESIQYKFTLYFIIVNFIRIFAKDTMEVYPTSMPIITNHIKKYYRTFYELSEEQLLKITPYTKVFVPEVNDNLKKVEILFHETLAMKFYSISMN